MGLNPPSHPIGNPFNRGGCKTLKSSPPGVLGYRVGPTAHHRRRSTGPIGCERTRAQVFEAVEAVLTLPALKGRKGKEAIRSGP